MRVLDVYSCWLIASRETDLAMFRAGCVVGASVEEEEGRMNWKSQW